MPEYTQDQTTAADQQVSAPAKNYDSFDKSLADICITSVIDVERLEKLLANARRKQNRASVQFASMAADCGLTNQQILTRLSFTDDYWVIYVDGDGDVHCTPVVDRTDD